MIAAGAQLSVSASEISDAIAHGASLRDRGDIQGALRTFKEVVRTFPGCVDGLINLGAILTECGRAHEAVECLRQALSLNATIPEAHNNLGLALRAVGDVDAADAAFYAAIEADPAFGAAYYNLGSGHLQRWDLDGARLHYRRSVELLPLFPAAYNNLGLTHLRAGDVDSAVPMFNRAITFHPEFVDAHWNLAHALLLRGDFSRGWEEYEWRWKKREFESLRARYGMPDWDGSSAGGERLLVFAEQGFGDLLQIARFLPLLGAQGVHVILEVPQSMVRLLSTLRGVGEIVARSDTIPQADACCGIMSIPYHCCATRSILPGTMPYLRASVAQTAMWQSRLPFSEPRLRVGIAWKGSATNPAGSYRSMNVHELNSLLDVPGVEWISLQKEESHPQQQSVFPHRRFHDVSHFLTDFSETAALIMSLDLVISVDTAVAHLAGALGKPVWTLISQPPDWRWLLGTTQSPWYPTMTLYRQSEHGAWAPTIGAVKADLARLLENHHDA